MYFGFCYLEIIPYNGGQVEILLLDEMQKLILIDGNAVLHRAYHAIPPFTSPAGDVVNAVYGFASVLLNILNTEKPQYIAVSFDTPKKTFRHIQYAEYKATRKKAPDDLYPQMPKIQELVKTFDIPIFAVDGFEADDVLGTLSLQAEELEDIKTYIFTGDMDILQLITEKTFVMTPTKGLQAPKIYDKAAVYEKYGITPSQIIDMKGLQGDNSDNIKGVRGVGPKTTKTLLQKHKNLEGVYEHADEIPGKMGENIRNEKESAFTSRELATIVRDVPIKLDLEACKSHQFDQERVANLFTQLGFKSLLRRLGNFHNHSEVIKKEEDSSQQTLF